MSESDQVYILGAGAIGFSLAVHLKNHGRRVTAVRTSMDEQPLTEIQITLQEGEGQLIQAPIEVVSLSKMNQMNGVVVITAKSYANRKIAAKLESIQKSSPIVILQNGIGVEKPFIDHGFSQIFRCIIYATSQKRRAYHYSYRPISKSPIGIISGDKDTLEYIINILHTDGFPFCKEMEIQKEIWKKAIINSVFNSICPLLEVDNGVFHRDNEHAQLAEQIVDECIQVTDRLRLGLDKDSIMEQIHAISRGSDGQLISTLQDIMNGRKTEIESLNLEISRIAENLTPPIFLNNTKLLGKMVLLKSTAHLKSC